MTEIVFQNEQIRQLLANYKIELDEKVFKFEEVTSPY